MKETKYLISLQHELNVIGHMSDPNSTSPDILSDGPVKYILRPVSIMKKQGSMAKMKYSPGACISVGIWANFPIVGDSCIIFFYPKGEEFLYFSPTDKSLS
jgi:hypothetical protein